MMNLMFVLLAKRAFPDIVEGVSSNHFWLAPFACSKSATFYINNAINL